MPLTPQEAEQKKQIEDAVWKMFGGRCAGHDLTHQAATLHHITPRSLSPRNYWRDPRNLIPICHELHEQVHTEGTKKWRDKLNDARARAALLAELGY